MATDNVSHTVHTFLRDDPMGQLIARHAQYSPGHPVFDEHENEQRAPAPALTMNDVPDSAPQGGPLLGGGPPAAGGGVGPQGTPVGQRGPDGEVEDGQPEDHPGQPDNVDSPILRRPAPAPARRR